MIYLFYSIYKLILRTPSKNEQPEHIANIILALILSFTLFGFIIVLEHFQVSISYDIWGSEVFFLSIYLGFIVLGYYAFIRGKKYLLIEKKFDSETRKSKILNLSLIALYLLLLIIINFVIN